ncbi:MAG: hypothetical protein KAU20_00130 [Nanoarchaeota archaeon]|nr:hypothetical protein [Nanoarchaeota archaeon]
MAYEQEISLTEVKENGKEFIADYPEGKNILRATDGKKNYEQIAKELELSKTYVSTVLNAAKKCHLANRITPGIFKKKSGVMSHIPEGKNKEKSVSSINKIIKRAKRKPKITRLNDKPFSNRPLINIEKMTLGYQNLFIVENTLRELIRKVFGKDVSNWWEEKVNDGIIKDVKEAIEKYPYHGYKREDELEYTHLGQLKEIITAKRNWNVFLPYLDEKDKASFSATIDKAIPSRNSIGHCIPLKNEDLKYVEMRFQDILRMIKLH